MLFFFFKQKTAYEMRISDWSSDVCSSDLAQDYAFAWNPRSGDAWVDTQLADINAYGSRYRGAFVDDLVRYHAAPRDLVNELVDARNWAPGDVHYACPLAQVVGRPWRSRLEDRSGGYGGDRTVEIRWSP